jgi:signal transduction histidine kinase
VTIRTRLTFWYSGMMFVSLLLMGGVLYYELVYEPQATSPAQAREAPPKQMLDILVFYGTPTLLLVLVGGWFLMRRTLAPITTLTDAIERVHAENLGHPLTGSRNGDELDRLTGVFNDMLTRLEQSFSRIRTFTLHASHELKTPLTVLRGEMETLLPSTELTATQREAVEGMLDELQRMARMVDDLALLTHAGAGPGLPPLARESVQLDELVREACEDARVLAEAKQIQIELVACEPVTVSGDRHRLRQLWLNLADNAVKHNEPAGRVRVSLRRLADPMRAEVQFENTGPGIAPDQLPLIFDPFFRGRAAREAKREGCGLGLSIVRWIVQAHGGEIQAISAEHGQTRIMVTLPARSI